MTLRFFRDPKPAPAFTVRDLEGREISTASLRGKVVIVNFWATWCGPCRAEIPDLVALQEKYKDTLQVIGISEDEAGVEVVKRFAAEHKVNYPMAMMTPELEKMFPGISALPTSFILDRRVARGAEARRHADGAHHRIRSAAPGGPAGQRSIEEVRSDAGAARSSTARRR